MIFIDIYELFISLSMHILNNKTHNSSDIAISDSPTDMLFGWVDLVSGEEWKIRIINMKRSIRESSYSTPENIKLLNSAFSSYTLRQDVFKILVNLEIDNENIKRLKNLKAFI